jgi:predicted GNAT family acetyltransferase
MLTLETYAQVGDFLGAAEGLLAREEAANNILYGIVRAAAANPDRVPEKLLLATVRRDGELLFAAVMTPPWRLLISLPAGPLEAEEFAPLIAHLRAQGWAVSGVTAAETVAAQFAGAWAAATGETAVVDVRMRLFELRQVVWPDPPAPGRFRPAALADVPLVFAWYAAFRNEAMPDDPPPTEEGVRRNVEEGRVFLWEDIRGGVGPVALAARGRDLPHGATIGPVYTPPAQRGRGYASAVVAALSQAILDSGKAYSALFTDLANPTSNRIYQALGYRPLRDFVEYGFHADDGSGAGSG